MAIRCPGCGREYDVTLFAFGRTLCCTCGRRVGLEGAPEPRPAHGEARFIADAMLGRLARWLRVLGYDTAFERDIDDETLVRRAWREQRILLTCDRALASEWRLGRYLLLRPDSPLAQLREVVTRFALDPGRPLFRRCTQCNEPVQLASASTIEGHVPERILREQRYFTRCPRCSRIYWEGSHTQRMRRTLDRALGD